MTPGKNINNVEKICVCVAQHKQVQKKPQAKSTVAPSVATLEMIVGVLGIVAAVVKTLADATT